MDGSYQQSYRIKINYMTADFLVLFDVLGMPFTTAVLVSH